jgi:subtilase family serine protease
MMIGSIPAGGSTTATSKWTAQSGSHSVKAVADVLLWVSESDETNNEKTMSFQISSTPMSTSTIIIPTITPTYKAIILSPKPQIDKNNPSSKAEMMI